MLICNSIRLLISITYFLRFSLQNSTSFTTEEVSLIEPNIVPGDFESNRRTGPYTRGEPYERPLQLQRYDYPVVID